MTLWRYIFFNCWMWWKKFGLIWISLSERRPDYHEWILRLGTVLGRFVHPALKVEYNDPHKHASKLHGFPFTSSTNTVVLVHKVKWKPRNLEAKLCGSLYSTLKHLSNHMHFITNGYKRLKTLKTLDDIGNCQRPVFSLGVSQHMHKITNLGKSC